MLLHLVKANRHQGKSRRSHPRHRHRRQTHSENPTEIGVACQIECGAAANEYTKYITDAENAVHDWRPAIQSKHVNRILRPPCGLRTFLRNRNEAKCIAGDIEHQVGARGDVGRHDLVPVGAQAVGAGSAQSAGSPGDKCAAAHPAITYLIARLPISTKLEIFGTI